MKNMTLAAALLLALVNTAHAGLLDAVTETASALTSAKATGSATNQALMELLKAKVEAGATKEEVKAKLGEPKAVAKENGNDIWKYDINSVDEKAGSTMAVASALGADTKQAQKIVELKFEGNTVKSYDIVAGTLTN